MPTTSTIVFPLANYPNGTRTSSGISVADSATTMQFSVQRCTSADTSIWPNATTTLDISIEQSNDGGTTWQFLNGFTAIGGIFSNAQGEVANSVGQIPLFAGTSRQVRATATIAGGPLRTSGTFAIT